LVAVNVTIHGLLQQMIPALISLLLLVVLRSSSFHWRRVIAIAASRESSRPAFEPHTLGIQERDPHLVAAINRMVAN
jgi:hypothetical protein